MTPEQVARHLWTTSIAQSLLELFKLSDPKVTQHTYFALPFPSRKDANAASGHVLPSSSSVSRPIPVLPRVSVCGALGLWFLEIREHKLLPL